MTDTKKLRLKTGQTLAITVPVPCLATTVTETTDIVEAVSLDENGDVITTPLDSRFAYDDSGRVAFDASFKLARRPTQTA